MPVAATEQRSIACMTPIPERNTSKFASHRAPVNSLDMHHTKEDAYPIRTDPNIPFVSNRSGTPVSNVVRAITSCSPRIRPFVDFMTQEVPWRGNEEAIEKG